MKYFVYIAGLRGPEAQKWNGDLTVNQKPIPTLAKHPLHEGEDNLSIEYLKERYPYELPKSDT